MTQSSAHTPPGRATVEPTVHKVRSNGEWHKETKPLRQLTEQEWRTIKAIVQGLGKHIRKQLTAYLQTRGPLREDEVLRVANRLKYTIQGRARAIEDGIELLELPEPAKSRRRK